MNESTMMEVLESLCKEADSLGLSVAHRISSQSMFEISQPPHMQLIHYRPGLAHTDDFEERTYYIPVPWTTFIFKAQRLEDGVASQSVIERHNEVLSSYPKNYRMFKPLSLYLATIRFSSVHWLDNLISSYDYLLPNGACMGDSALSVFPANSLAEIILSFWSGIFNDDSNSEWYRSRAFRGLDVSDDEKENISHRYFEALSKLSVDDLMSIMDGLDVKKHQPDKVPF